MFQDIELYTFCGFLSSSPQRAPRAWVHRANVPAVWSIFPVSSPSQHFVEVLIMQGSIRQVKGYSIDSRKAGETLLLY